MGVFVRKRLFNKRVLFITGKGGVGKTTISAALAFAAADRGLNVCLVEVAQSTSLRSIFGRDIPIYTETKVEENITAITLDPFEALNEYVAKQARVKKFADWILNNQVIQYLTQAAPGWRELITVGKIWHIESQTVGYKKRPKYDIVIVDAPATGHGISFLRVPAVILDLLSFGPLRSQTFEVQKMLLDPDRTMLNVVTLPEEMSVNEAVFLHKAAKETLDIPYGFTFVNAVFRPLFDPAERKLHAKLEKDATAMGKIKTMFKDKGKALFAAATERGKRAEQSERYSEQVLEQIGPPMISIPRLIGQKMDREAVLTIAKAINDSLPEEDQ
jgi:anion-transporting  ArsA/GET3 family ATPase